MRLYPAVPTRRVGFATVLPGLHLFNFEGECMRKVHGSRGLGYALSRATRQRFDRMFGGSRRHVPLADALTQSIANELIAPSNNMPGREFGRRGWGNNLAGMVTQEITNGLEGRTARRKKGRTDID
jgi:hypothetical protein